MKLAVGVAEYPSEAKFFDPSVTTTWDAVRLVSVTVLVTAKVSPKNTFFATAIPPAVVNEPPFVELDASVAFDDDIPPAVVIAPVELLVEAVAVEADNVVTDVFAPVTVSPRLAVNNALTVKAPVTETVVPVSNIVAPVPASFCSLSDPASFLSVAVFIPPSAVLAELFKNRKTQEAVSLHIFIKEYALVPLLVFVTSKEDAGVPSVDPVINIPVFAVTSPDDDNVVTDVFAPVTVSPRFALTNPDADNVVTDVFAPETVNPRLAVTSPVTVRSVNVPTDVICD